MRIIAAATFAGSPGMWSTGMSVRRMAGLFAYAGCSGSRTAAAKKGVRIMPGSTSVVWMPKGSTSEANAS